MDIHRCIAIYRSWDARPTDPYSAKECTNACSAIAEQLGVHGSSFRSLIQQRRREGYDIETILFDLVNNFS